MAVVHVSGKKSASLMLYALSTCVWCQKTKRLLDELGVEYDYEFVDTLEGEQKQQAIEKVKVWNPRCSFPTLIVNNQRCIVGYKEDEIREAVK